MTVKTLICIPWSMMSDAEIADARTRATKRVLTLGGEPVCFDAPKELRSNQNVRDGDTDPFLYILSEMIRLMAGCRAVFMVKEWQHALETRIENSLAVSYGLTVYREEEFE